MSRSSVAEIAPAQTNRLKAAAIGFGITVAPAAVMAAAQFAFLPQIVASVEGLDSNEQTWAVSILRRDWLTFHAVAATLVVGYWLLAATFARGQLLQSKPANTTLAISIIGFVCLTVYGTFFQFPVEIKGVCQFLGITDTIVVHGFDAQSSCDMFSRGVHIIIVLGLFGLSVVLLAVSAILRIASTRRARQATA